MINFHFPGKTEEVTNKTAAVENKTNMLQKL